MKRKTTFLKASVAGVVVLGFHVTAFAIPADGDDFGMYPTTDGPEVMAKVSTAGLKFLGNQLSKLAPSGPMSFANMEDKLMGCPLISDMKLKLSEIQTQFQVDPVEITTTTSGEISIQTSVSVTGTLRAKVENIACIKWTSATCDEVSFAAYDVPATASFRPYIENNRVKLGTPNITIGLTKQNFQFNLSKCPGSSIPLVDKFIDHTIPVVGDVADKGWTMVIGLLFKGTMVDTIKSTVQKQLAAEAAPMIEKELNKFTNLEGTQNEVSFKAEFKSVYSGWSGVGIEASTDVNPLSWSTCAYGADPKVPSVYGYPALNFQGTEHLGLAVSTATIQKAFKALWRRGMFCLSGDKLDELGVPSNIANSLGVIVGMSSEAETTFSISPSMPPEISSIVGTTPKFRIKVPALSIWVKGETHEGESASMDIDLDVDVVARVDLDPSTRGITLYLEEVTFSKLTLTATPEGSLNADVDFLKTTLESILKPILKEQFSARELVPHVLHDDSGFLNSYYLVASRGETTYSHVQLYAKLFRRPDYDGEAPTTNLVEKPTALTGPRVFRFVASGTDDLTPESLVRFRWRVDSGVWSSPRFSAARNIELKEGTHTIEVKAVDLNGNEDSSPSSFTVDVDGTVPTITLLKDPGASVTNGQALIEWKTTDDRTDSSKIGSSIKIEYTPEGGGASSKLRDDPYLLGLSKINLASLKNGSYRVQISAQDEAGNISNTTVIKFSVTGGLPSGSVQPGNDSVSENDHTDDNEADNIFGDDEAALPPTEINGGCSLGENGLNDYAMTVLLFGLVALATLRRKK